MQRSIMGVLFCCLPLWASEMGTKIIYDVRKMDETLEMTTTIYFIAAEGLRCETIVPALPMANTVLIRKGAGDKSYILLPRHEAYIEQGQPAKQPHSHKDSVAHFRPTGQSKKIAGYFCDVFRRKVSGREEEVCATSQLSDALALLQKLLPDATSHSLAFPAGISGLPLEYIIRSQNRVEMEMHAGHISRETFHASLFEVPKGYHKRKPPHIPTQGATR